MKRIDNFEKGKPVEIGIPGADLADSVLTHEDGCVSIMQEIAGQVRDFLEDPPGNFGVPWRRNKQIQTGGGEKCRNELPCF